MATTLTLTNGSPMVAEKVSEQTVALAGLYTDAGLERWHAAALVDPRRGRRRDDLALYLNELVVVLAAEIEARSDGFILGVEVEHELAR